jgi:hypothetical protein
MTVNTKQEKKITEENLGLHHTKTCPEDLTETTLSDRSSNPHMDRNGKACPVQRVVEDEEEAMATNTASRSPSALLALW